MGEGEFSHRETLEIMNLHADRVPLEENAQWMEKRAVFFPQNSHFIPEMNLNEHIFHGESNF